MALKDSWIPLQNKIIGVPDSGSEVSVEPINKIADAVIKLEEEQSSNNNYKGYPYIVENMDDYLYTIVLRPNTVTYTYGNTTQSGELNFNLMLEFADDDISEEKVLIIDLSDSASNTPTISFEGNIKWLNGEPPEIVAGKVYMFSFVRAQKSANRFYLGIGGEFA